MYTCLFREDSTSSSKPLLTSFPQSADRSCPLLMAKARKQMTPSPQKQASKNKRFKVKEEGDASSYIQLSVTRTSNRKSKRNRLNLPFHFRFLFTSSNTPLSLFNCLHRPISFIPLFSCQISIIPSINNILYPSFTTFAVNRLNLK